MWASQVALLVKNLIASTGDKRDAGSTPGSGGSPGKARATYSSIPTWKNPVDWDFEEPGGLQDSAMGVTRVRHD